MNTCILIQIILLSLSRETQIIRTTDTGAVVEQSTGSSGTALAQDEMLHRGWPVDLSAPGAGFPYTATLADIDADGDLEIFLTGGETFGLDGDGTFLPGWPTSDMAHMGYATNAQMPGPSCADINGSGTVEVMWSERDWYAGSSHMWTFNGRTSGGTDLPGFPATAPDQSSNALASPFVLGDADGDGTLEAVTAHTLGNTGDYYRISSLDHDGNIIFTRDLDPTEDILGVYFGDPDGNGSEEFFAVTVLSGYYRLYLMDQSGNDQTGYPVSLCALQGSLMFGPPIPADLDGDGDLELLVGYSASSSARAVAVHHDGSPVSGFPVTVATGSQLFYLGLGDITGDDQPELLAFDNELGSGYRAHALDLDTGAPLSGWPFSLPGWPKGFPTVVDIDNDGFQDVCFVTDGGLLYALSGSGSLLPDFPRTMSNASVSGVAAGDIDGDGLYELVAATWDGFVYAWDTEGAVMEGNADWPMRGVDQRNTGVFRGASQQGVEHQSNGICFSILSNPVMDSAVFRLTGSSQCSSVSIFDLYGRRIAEVTVNSGTGIWHNTAGAGIYFARVENTTLPTVRFAVTGR